MKLATHHYGKSRVRVLKVLHEENVHTVKELDVTVSLSGNFESSYTSGDNSQVVATDTIKNTVNVLAYQHLGPETERFVCLLAEHFRDKYAQVGKVIVKASERVWERLRIDETPHPHSFQNSQQARPFMEVTAEGSSISRKSGIADLLILKSTQSGFEGFPRCEYTTLPETGDRIFATALTATWTWAREPAEYTAANNVIIEAMLVPFAVNFSPSVQKTLFEMGGAALQSCPAIAEIHLSMPNKHCLPINLEPFGLKNHHDVFVPTDEPFGLIEALVTRD